MGLAEYLVAGTEPRDVPSDRLDDPRQIRSWNGVLRLQEPRRHQTKDIGPAGHDMPHVRVNRGRANPHQHLVIPDPRLVDFAELENVLGWAVLILDDRLHPGRPLNRCLTVDSCRRHD